MAYVPVELRQVVVARSNQRCEYCLYPQEMSFLAFEIEHVIAEKYGGVTIAENLAFSCPYCNRFKGTDLGSLDPETGQLTPFFDPREQHWEEHFKLDGAIIRPLTPEGRVTITILQLNHPDRVEERQQLIEVGLYP